MNNNYLIAMNMYLKPEKYNNDDHDINENQYYPFVANVGKREGGVGGAAQRCVRDAGASPAQTPTPAPPAPPAPPAHVKCERFSPQESVASRSRSATPSTSSYPGTPPERGSPHAPPLQVPAHPPRNYSDIMRSLAARYNTHPQNDYYHRVNGFGAEARAAGAPAQPDGTRILIGGIFTSCSRQQRIAVYPPSMDMTYTKILAQAMRLGHCARNRRKRVHPSAAADHSPLDLSAGTENAAKRARLSSSPSTRSDSDDRDRVSNDDHNVECMCAEARARVSAWSVEDVFHFVNSIDICAEYATNFREQRIDGAGLPLLTEDHLTGMLQMKLGPALKLKAMLNKKLDPCAQCQAAATATNTTPANATNTAPKLNGTSLKSEPRSNSTSPV